MCCYPPGYSRTLLPFLAFVFVAFGASCQSPPSRETLAPITRELCVGNYYFPPLCSEACACDLTLRADGSYTLKTTYPAGIGPIMPPGERAVVTENSRWSWENRRVILLTSSGEKMILFPKYVRAKFMLTSSELDWVGYIKMPDDNSSSSSSTPSAAPANS